MQHACSLRVCFAWRWRDPTHLLVLGEDIGGVDERPMKKSQLIKYLEGLSVTQGEGAGQLIRLFPWERRFVLGAFGTPGDSALSVGRGNGKSCLLSAVATAFLDGPLRQPRAEVLIVASSFSQGKISFDHCRAFLGVKLDDRRVWRVADSDQSAVIEHRPTGAKLRTLGCDPRRAHGTAANLILCDEGAQWEPSKSERMLAALRTGLGKIPNSRLIALGTRPESSSHWFSQMLAGGAAYSQSHHADPDDDPFKRRTWHKANPSLRYMPSLMARIEKEAQEAKADPSKLASFRALRLNMGVSDVEKSYLIEASDWQRIEGAADRSGPYVLGVDLGTNSAMSACAAFWPETGALDCVACFPEKPDLKSRGLADGVGRLYCDMLDRGELIIRGTRVSSLGGLLAEVRDRWGFPLAIAFDRWREAELRDHLEDAKFPLARLEVRGMGFKDGAEDVRAFRSACMGGSVRPVKSLLLTAAMSEARVVSDPAGNAKLAKGSEGGRRVKAKDDAAAAGILAVSAGVRLWRDERPNARGVYLGAV